MTEAIELFLPAESPRALVAITRPSGVDDVPASALVGSVELESSLPRWDTLELNPQFVSLYSSYMRGERRLKHSILSVRVNPGEYVYVIDGRVADPAGEVPFHDTIGWYRSTSNGMPDPSTFEYNPDHRMFSDNIPSSMLRDPQLILLAYES